MQRVSPESSITTNRSGLRRRRDGNSNQDSARTKLQRKTQTLPKRSGASHDGGQQFEVKMAALIGLRAMARGKDFQLQTKNSDCGNFDHIVYKTSKESYFLQLKRTDNPDEKMITKGDLGPLLLECFDSYCQLINEHKFKGNSPNNSEFIIIIYTNKQLGPDLLLHSRQPRDIDILKTSDEGEIFTFTPDKNKEIDIYTLVENLAKERNIFRRLSLPERGVKFRISEFLEKLIMATGQKGQRQLYDLVIEEIRKQDAVKVSRTVYERELLYFKKPLESWWRDKKDSITPEMLRNWLQRAKRESCSSLVSSLSDTYCKTFVGRGFNFSDNEISRLQKELSEKRSVHLRSDALTLCSVLLLDCLPASKCIFITFEFLQKNEDMLLHAWLGGHWEWLIVTCDSTVRASDISDTCRKISEPLKCDTWSKRAIILTERSVEKITDFDPIEYRFSFEQLSQEAQTIVLEKKVDFQGFVATMRSILQRHRNVVNVLGPELVTDLITEESPINIGGRLQESSSEYQPRVFKRKVWLPLDILGDRDTYPDIFVVSGTEENVLADFVPSDQEVRTYGEDSETGNRTKKYNVFEKTRFILLKSKQLKSSFSELCKNHIGETLHWLKYKDKKLLWKETRGDIDNLLNCIDAEVMGVDRCVVRQSMKLGSCEVNEESIWDLNERSVLVVAESSMGKSSTTTRVAWNTKRRDPDSWVLRINWNDHTSILQGIDTATFDFECLLQFLCTATFPQPKYADTNRSLLKQALEITGNVTVLMDGFDELSSAHADKAVVILSVLMKTKVGTVWVTSHPLLSKELEKQLSVIPFIMKKLSDSSQKSLLPKLCLTTENGYNHQEHLHTFIQCYLPESESHKNCKIIGTPIYVKKIAVAKEGYKEKCLRSRPMSQPKYREYSSCKTQLLKTNYISRKRKVEGRLQKRQCTR